MLNAILQARAGNSKHFLVLWLVSSAPDIDRVADMHLIRLDIKNPVKGGLG
ncbi:MAG: hypothetical protein NVS2B16_09210 [Chloroflexota bacterium]